MINHESDSELVEWYYLLQKHKAENLPYIGYSLSEIEAELKKREILE